MAKGLPVVELDPSVEDWDPPCVVCGEPITDWADAIAIGVARCEDDEPEALRLYHRSPCDPTTLRPEAKT